MWIKLKFASVAHPKTNGRVEKANVLICNWIEKRLLAPLEKAKHAWVDDLPSSRVSELHPMRLPKKPPSFWSTAKKPCF
jgi:hypothetical protein